jgi:hypothetical protein
MKRFLQTRFCGAPLLSVVALAIAIGLPNLGFAQAQQQPGTAPGSPPPTPAVPPPIASHSDPKAPVPTNPPEQIAPPAHVGDAKAATPLPSHPALPGSTGQTTAPATTR